MEYVIVLVVAFGASMLTFFSGFGLGTMLTPAFILFFPPEIAVAATAIVHFTNNLFKLTLIGKHAVKEVVLKFGVPAILGAFLGAWLLGMVSHNADHSVQLMGFETSAINLLIGIMIIVFSLFELIPALKKLEFGKQWLVPGGIISGFFGGVSGHQGALRSAFLIKVPMSKEQFVASGIVIACFVDTMRIGTYAFTFDFSSIADSIGLIIAATGCAFVGAIIGRRLLKKVTINALQTIVGVLMIAIGFVVMLGIA
ncbi:MAG: sulfite exporter TauE/SafE family protein [Flavobacteriales bacterium]